MMATWEEALKYLKEKLFSPESTAKSPEEVIKHSIKVSEVASSIAEKIETQGTNIDVELVEIGGILHDIGRRDDQTIRHGYVGSLVLEEDEWGYELANMAANHVLVNRDLAVILGIPKRHYAPFTLEEVVLTYADKIVRGEEEVGLDERWKYLDKKYSGSFEGEGWYNVWKKFANYESYELQEEVNGLLEKGGNGIPSLIDTLKLLAKGFSRVENKENRVGITKHSLAISAYSSLIAKNIKESRATKVELIEKDGKIQDILIVNPTPEFDEERLKKIRYAGLLHDVGRGSAWAVEHPLVGKMILECRRYPKEVVGATIGHCIFPDELAEELKFPKPWDKYRPINNFDRIVTYADKRIYLDQLLPDIGTRYRIWARIYGQSKNFNIWFPEMERGLDKIQRGMVHISKRFDFTPKEVNEEVNLILGDYGVSRQEAYQILGIQEPVVVGVKSV